MSCNKINTCFRYGTDYKDRLISFPNGIAGLSNFRYEISQRETVINLTVGNGLEIIGEKVCIQGDALESLLPDAYDTVFWLDINGQTRDLFSEDLEISADKCDCQNLYNLAFTIIPVDISENVVNIYLSWEDLTPEQILELQQPAIDAGNEVRQQVDEYIEAKELQINPVILAAQNATQEANDAAQTANTAAQNADEKATAAQTAANNANNATSAANTATTNANNATLAANTAATNAQDEADAAQQINENVQLAENTRISNENTRQNQESTRQTNENTRVSNESARVLAESARVTASATAVTNANNAANNANNAASFANSQRGWTPIHSFEADGAQRQVKKLTDYIGGTGTKPTANIGQYVIDGGYTADKSLATNFKGEQGDNLIFEQTFNNNKVVTIESIDYLTNTFYATSHGLTQAMHALVLNNDVNTLNPSVFLPIITNNGLFLKVDTLTANSFQLTTSSNGLGEPVVFTNQTTADVTKFKVERMQNPTIITGLSFLNMSRCKIEINGSVIRAGYSYPVLQDSTGFSFVSNNTSVNLNSNTSVSAPFSLTSLCNYKFVRIIDIDVKNSVEMIEEMIGLNLSPTNTSNVINAKRYTFSRTANVTNNIITGFAIIDTGAFMSNGTTIKIYKK